MSIFSAKKKSAWSSWSTFGGGPPPRRRNGKQIGSFLMVCWSHSCGWKSQRSCSTNSMKTDAFCKSTGSIFMNRFVAVSTSTENVIQSCQCTVRSNKLNFYMRKYFPAAMDMVSVDRTSIQAPGENGNIRWPFVKYDIFSGTNVFPIFLKFSIYESVLYPNVLDRKNPLPLLVTTDTISPV